MNKANKNEAKVASLWNYLNSDRKWLVPNRERTRTVKRTITRMTRRMNKALCAEVAQ